MESKGRGGPEMKWEAGRGPGKRSDFSAGAVRSGGENCPLSKFRGGGRRVGECLTKICMSSVEV